MRLRKQERKQKTTAHTNRKDNEKQRNILQRDTERDGDTERESETHRENDKDRQRQTVTETESD